MTKEQLYKVKTILGEISRYKKLLNDVNQNLTSVTFTTAYISYTYSYSKLDEEILDMIKTAITDACNAKIEELLEELNQIWERR